MWSYENVKKDVDPDQLEEYQRVMDTFADFIINFGNLTTKVQRLLEEKRPVVIAISGFGGSGKSTLAEKLNTHFNDSTKLQLDNFLVNHGEGSGWQGGYGWKRFERALKDISAGKDLHYQCYDWEKNEVQDWIDQPLPSLVIVEGVRIFQPELMPYFDLSIWISRSLEEAIAQGKNRDKANNTGEKFDIESHIKKWDDVWVPKEKEFVELFDPAGHADVLYS